MINRPGAASLGGKAKKGEEKVAANAGQGGRGAKEQLLSSPRQAPAKHRTSP